MVKYDIKTVIENEIEKLEGIVKDCPDKESVEYDELSDELLRLKVKLYSIENNIQV